MVTFHQPLLRPVVFAFFFSRTWQLIHKTGGHLITRPDGNVLAATLLIFYFFDFFLAQASEPKAVAQFVLVN